MDLGVAFIIGVPSLNASCIFTKVSSAGIKKLILYHLKSVTLAIRFTAVLQPWGILSNRSANVTSTSTSSSPFLW